MPGPTFQCCLCCTTIQRDSHLLEIATTAYYLDLPEDRRWPDTIAYYAHKACLEAQLHHRAALDLPRGAKPQVNEEWPSVKPLCCLCGDSCSINGNLLKLQLARFRGGRALLWAHKACFEHRRKNAF